MKTIDAAKGKWPGILREFGFTQAQLGRKHQCCPITGEGEDRFRFSDRNGSGSYFCACSPDGRKGGFDLLKCKTGQQFAELAASVDKLIGNTPDAMDKPNRADPMPLLREIQRRATPPGIEVTRYLEGRGLFAPRSLREIAGFEYWSDGSVIGRNPAMAAKIVDAKGKPQSWHITYLDDGKKANYALNRKVMPPIKSISGACVRLFPQAEHIGIAEGIETAIAAHILYKAMPVWSCISRGGLESFEPPEGVRSVTIFGDNDRSFSGQAGAYRAAENLKRRKISVEVVLPERVGDFNDVLQGLA